MLPSALAHRRGKCLAYRADGLAGARGEPAWLSPRRSARSAHLVAHSSALPPRLTLQARDDVPRIADVLEPGEEGLDPLWRNLDDVVHAGLLRIAAAFHAVLMARGNQRGGWVGQNAQRRERRPRGFQKGAVVSGSAFF
jgi:hypothetical protein